MGRGSSSGDRRSFPIAEKEFQWRSTAAAVAAKGGGWPDSREKDEPLSLDLRMVELE